MNYYSSSKTLEKHQTCFTFDITVSPRRLYDYKTILTKWGLCVAISKRMFSLMMNLSKLQSRCDYVEALKCSYCQVIATQCNSDNLTVNSIMYSMADPCLVKMCSRIFSRILKLHILLYIFCIWHSKILYLRQLQKRLKLGVYEPNKWLIEIKDSI